MFENADRVLVATANVGLVKTVQVACSGAFFVWGLFVEQVWRIVLPTIDQLSVHELAEVETYDV